MHHSFFIYVAQAFWIFGTEIWNENEDGWNLAYRHDKITHPVLTDNFIFIPNFCTEKPSQDDEGIEK